MSILIMYIYPDVNVDAAGGAGQYVPPEKTKTDDETQQQPEFKVSAFSSYDSDHNSTVTGGSEVSDSAFTQKDVTTNVSGLFSSDVTSQQRAQIISQTNSVFNASGRFEGMVSDFSQTVGSPTQTFSSQAEAEQFQRSEAAKLDADVKAATQQFSAKINEDIYAAYTSEIKSSTEEVLAQEPNFNGEISDIKQGGVGDCWVLSEVKALSRTGFGRQALSEALDKNHAGTPEDPYLLTIYDTEGNKKTIKVTKDDIAKYGNGEKKYSDGDPNLNIIEAGLCNYFKEEIAAGRMKDRDLKDPLEGSPFGRYSATYMLTGKLPHGLTTVEIRPENAEFFTQMTDENMEAVLQQFADNPDNMALTCAFNDRSSFQKMFGTTKRDAQVDNHAFYVTGVSRKPDGSIDTVTYKNPWDTSTEYTISFSKFRHRVAQLEYVQG